MLSIHGYIEHLKERQANEDISNILARQKQETIRQEISLLIEGLK